MRAGLYMTSGYSRRFSLLDEYESAVSDELPSSLPRFWSISRTDAFTMGRFLDILGGEVIVLDIGTFMGISAFWFAVQPTVSRVISVDPNPRIADEVWDKEDTSDFEADYDSLQDVRVLDIAHAALRGFDASSRIILSEGVVGVEQSGVHGDSLGSVNKVEVPALDESHDLSLVAFVDGLHTSDGVLEDLRSIFSRSPNTIAFLHDCRTAWASSVFEGVKRFVNENGGEHHFELLSPPAPGLGQPNLGILYSGHSALQVRSVLNLMNDPVRLLRFLAASEIRHPASLGRFMFAPRVRHRIAAEAKKAILGSRRTDRKSARMETSER